VCRVPKADLEEGKLIMCKNCGCRGCASTDWSSHIESIKHIIVSH
jgi:bud site selection protein 31